MSMNLHDMVRSSITLVNEDQAVTLLPCVGQTQTADYQQAAVYGPAVVVKGQVQPVQDKALQWLLQTRQNSVWRDVYLYGPVAGLERSTERGGDFLYFEGYEWEVDQVLEHWSATAGWTKVRCIQVRACEPPAEGATFRPGKEAASWPD